MLAITGHSSLSKTDAHRHPTSESVSPLADIKNEPAIDIDKKIQTIFELILLEEFLTTAGATLLPVPSKDLYFLLINMMLEFEMKIAE